MNYRIEYCPNPDCLLIHVDQRLARETTLSFDCFEFSKQSKKIFEERVIDAFNLISFCRAISGLDGVEEHITFGRYHIQMMKVSSFTWKKILPCVLDALQVFISRDGKLVESFPAKMPNSHTF